MKKDQKLYTTSDLALVTTLSLWFPIETINRANPKNTQFSFKQSNKLDNFLKNYWRQELKIEPQSFYQQLRFVKSRIYEKT